MNLEHLKGFERTSPIFTKQYLDDLTCRVIGAAIEVHKTLGRGLLESIYKQCLMHELKERKIQFQTEMKVPVIYKDIIIDHHLRCDLFIEGCLVVELKAAVDIPKIYQAQLLTYMKLLKAPKGILINFNCSHLFSQGQQTYINQFFNLLPDS